MDIEDAFFHFLKKYVKVKLGIYDIQLFNQQMFQQYIILAKYHAHMLSKKEWPMLAKVQ